MIQECDGRAPDLHSTAWVHEGAWVIGDVWLGAEVSIWPGAVVRGDMGPIRIGAQTNVQDGAVLHDTTNLSETILGERVTVGHRAVLHGCIIEDECLIGSGAIVLDNAHIGTGSIVGAGALVPLNRVIPPHSLVFGTPARVVRTVTATDRKLIESGWREYIEKCRYWRERERRHPG
ncbi:MAG: gamma carbonic anhydrase family protein [Deltaproteobacteria bacterium]|nr:gamma carbonic anhydrase family protein [Deltaproteobacteria bacterium]